MTKTAETPQQLPTLVPHLVCDGASDAIEFYKRAFGAEEVMRLAGDNGKLMHASIRLNGGVVMLVDANAQFNIRGPKDLGGSPVTIHLTVPDVDKSFAKAVDAGAKPTMPPADMFWGDRYSALEDPFGHKWSIATPKKALTAEEIAEAARKAMPDYAKCGPNDA